MYKFLASAMLCCTLALTACSTNYNSDEVPDVSPENLYNVAKANMATGDFSAARRYLEAIDSRYPFGDLTTQVQLDLIYVYYKQRESELASAQIARFIRLSPTHPNIDYVYYMKGLTQIQKRSDMLQDYLGLDRAEKDPTEYLNAFNTFRDLINSYPDSLYAADARQRMIYIKEELASREFAIAKYYERRGAYLSAIRHAQSILYTYRNTSQFQPAMELMAKCYDRLNLTEAAEHTRQVMEASFGKDYEPSFMANASSPVSGADDLPGTPQEGLSRSQPQAEKGWFDTLTSWLVFWGDDNEQSASADAQKQSSSQEEISVYPEHDDSKPPVQVP